MTNFHNNANLSIFFNAHDRLLYMIITIIIVFRTCVRLGLFTLFLLFCTLVLLLISKTNKYCGAKVVVEITFHQSNYRSQVQFFVHSFGTFLHEVIFS